MSLSLISYARILSHALRQRRLFKSQYGISPSLLQLMIDLPSWHDHRGKQATPLSEGIPWITFGAIRFLERRLLPSAHVFEWGMGGSTAFFLNRCKHVTSVEHDDEWFLKAHNVFGASEKWSPLHIKPTKVYQQGDVADWASYRTSDESYGSYEFGEYARAICRFPDESLDLIVVDGRARPSCFHHALSKIKRGGYIVWDNTERVNYHRAMSCVQAKDFSVRHFAGAQPFVPHFTQTSIWTRR